MRNNYHHPSLNPSPLRGGKSKRLFVLSLGGSLIVPGEIDVKFLQAFKKIIVGQIKKGHRFIIVTGGGKTARNYQGALRQVSKVSNDVLDWMGIGATYINAELVMLMLGRLAHPKPVTH